jgi:hypothetical protein
MPRYPLDDTAMAALEAYLRQLSATAAPGVAADTLNLAAVLAPDADPQARAGVKAVLRALATEQGQWGLRWDLQFWELSGPAAGWRAQLDQHYRDRPVFALLSGAGRGDWLPVHEFCEQRRVACLFPALEAAPERDGDFYSLYYSAGVSLEARILARHLETGGDPDAARPRIVQAYADATGEGAARAVEGTLARPAASVDTRRLIGGTEDRLLGAPGDLILWLRPAQIEALAKRSPDGPAAGRVFLSQTLCPPDALSLPPAWKRRVRYLSIFDPLAGQRLGLALLPWLKRGDIAPADLRAQADAYGAGILFAEALARIQGERLRGLRGQLSREDLLETLETVVTGRRHGATPFYWQTSLSPGQRIAVRSGGILGYRDGDSDELVPLGERITP